ncbi:MAG: pyruvate kinase [Bacteroidota bacterium]|nr:pyruvate kinase [Bacteroidota bacterium]
MKKLLHELLLVFQKINQQRQKYLQQHQNLILSVSDDKRESIENFVSYISYMDNKLECERIISKHDFPIVFSETENFHNSIGPLMRMAGFSSDLKKIPNLLSENVSGFFGKEFTGKPQLMVNLRQEAEYNQDYLQKLLNNGVGFFRINCAFGKHKSWQAISENLKSASTHCGIQGKLLMDLAGPKIRIEKLFKDLSSENSIRLQENEELIIANSPFSIADNHQEFKNYHIIKSNFTGDFSSCRPGEIIRFDDSRIEAHIVGVEQDYLKIIIKKLIRPEENLLPGKGINFPESSLGISGLTEKDKIDLSGITNIADVLCFSFVQSAADIIEIEREILKHDRGNVPVVIKIETYLAIENIEEILLAAMRIKKVAILVARGDLVSECGWEALPAIQERIFKLAKAAHLPTILATEIMESFNQTGIHTRPDVIDLYHARNFDCLLINKGPNIFGTIDFVNEFFE